MASYVPETPIQGPPGVLAPGKRPLDVAVARPAQGQKQFPQIDLPSKPVIRFWPRPLGAGRGITSSCC
jgi:hypothetical protein